MNRMVAGRFETAFVTGGTCGSWPDGVFDSRMQIAPLPRARRLIGEAQRR